MLDALQAVGLQGDGRILQLNSYENRVFQVFLEDGSAVVTKFYRPGRWSDAQILEEHAFALELAAQEVPVVAPLVLDHGGAAPVDVQLLGQPSTLACLHTLGSDGREVLHRFGVWPRCAGREPELEDPAAMRQLGRFIGRLHAVGRLRPFEHRLAMRPGPDGLAAQQLLLEGGFVTDAERPAWLQASQQAIAAIEGAFDALTPLGSLRLHGDCHLGNVLWRDGGPHVVDLDDAVQGPAVQDLWMLTSGDRSTLQGQLSLMLEGYEQFCDFDDRETALIEPLRTLRMLRHSAWLAARWEDPSFPLNFSFFGSAAYWSQQTAQLREQLELMQA